MLSQETTGRRKVLDQPFLGVTSWPGLICTSAWVTGVTVYAFINHIIYIYTCYIHIVTITDIYLIFYIIMVYIHKWYTYIYIYILRWVCVKTILWLESCPIQRTFCFWFMISNKCFINGMSIHHFFTWVAWNPSKEHSKKLVKSQGWSLFLQMLPN